MMTLKFLFQYPETNGVDGEMLDAGPVADVAVAAEGSGWSGLSFTEHPAPTGRWLRNGGHQSIDPFVALGHVAAVTSTLQLLTYLCVLPYRNPTVVAKSAATVDLLSGGRFILGVGAGYLKAEYRAVGVDFEERNEIFDEALDVLPLHWSGEPFDYEGRHFSCRDTIGRPRPIRQPIPIWIGGNSNLTLRRVAERAQGWMPMLGPAAMFSTVRSPEAETFDDLLPRLASLRQLAGQRFATLDINVPYLDPSIYTFSDVERHRDAFGRLEEMGATWIAINGPSAAHPAAIEFAERFGETYLR